MCKSPPFRGLIPANGVWKHPFQPAVPIKWALRIVYRPCPGLCAFPPYSTSACRGKIFAHTPQGFRRDAAPVPSARISTSAAGAGCGRASASVVLTLHFIPGSPRRSGAPAFPLRVCDPPGTPLGTPPRCGAPAFPHQLSRPAGGPTAPLLACPGSSGLFCPSL